MADLIAQDPVERGARERLGAWLAKMREQRHGDGLAETEHAHCGEQDVLLE
jgi:hypothetical protein